MVAIQRLHQIELSSHCNLRCRYCVNPNLQRPKLYMSEDDYRASLKWARMFVRQRLQTELNLAGLGEATMHPDFIKYVALAREAVGWNCWLVFSSNGVLLDDHMCRELAKYKPTVFISVHRAEYAGPAMEAAARAGLQHQLSTDPVTHAMDIAGQVDWYVADVFKQCPPECWWIKDGRVMVMADGRVTTCCLDGSGCGTLGHVTDDITQMRMRPYVLCESCHQQLPDSVRRRMSA